MKNLKANRLAILIYLFISCTSIKDYHVDNPKGNGPVSVFASSQRFLPMCELVNNEGLYGFMVLVLDEENTVFSTGFRLISTFEVPG